MEKRTEINKEKKRGRPTGSTNKTPAGALTLSTAEIIKTIEAAAEPEGTPVLLKEPTPQPGLNGTSSGRIYCPAEWIGKPVLCMRLTPATAAELKAEDLKAQADELKKQAAETRAQK